MSLADDWHSLILGNAVDMMRYDAHLRAEITGMIKTLGRDLAQEIINADLETPRTDWQRARLRSLLVEADSKITSAYSDVLDVHTSGMKAAVDAHTTGLVAAMNESAGVELLDAIKWSPKLLKALVDDTLVNGAPIREWWTRQTQDLVQAFTDQMRQGMLRGENVAQLTSRVKPLEGVAERNAETLVRTSAMAVNNAAQVATYAENADVLKALQWCATLDPRTCLGCGVEDGEQWEPDDSTHMVPPLHWNCRCVVVPITKLWDDLGIEPPAGKRATIDGPIDKNTTWESWVKGLSEERQSEILGPSRLKLWKAGKLTISDLVDQRGNTLTLEQLTGK